MRRHGTRAKYVQDGCRCQQCVEANRIYARNRERNRRRADIGIEDRRIAYMDCSEARDHLRWLSSVGVGKQTVHRVSGVALSSIYRIRNGELTKARETTINRILAVGTHLRPSSQPIDSTSTWQLLDDLVYLGFSKTTIARQAGYRTPAVQLKRGRRVKPSTALRYAAAYQQLTRQLPAWHGSYAGYAKRCCRCLRCSSAARDYRQGRSDRERIDE